jgi:hypothetical protein
MFPGSTLSTSLQIAAADIHKSACENEEEYAQKYGRVVHLSDSGHSKLLVLVSPLALSIYAILLVAYFLYS